MDATGVSLQLLGPDDAAVLDRVADGVFDHAIVAASARDFLADPRHHIVVAVDAGIVVGFASAVVHFHPDKPPHLFVNEVGVGPTHARRGIARRLLERMFEHGAALGCTEAWVGTETGNTAARALYRAAGGNEDDEPFILYTFDLRRPA